MALDYILNNTGPEVQERLDQVPVTQAQLTDEIADREAADAAETQAREAADAALQDSIGAEATRAEGTEQSLDGRITDVEGKIPQGATPQNPLADKDWVADSIATATDDFITASVNNLINYYLKSETYTREEVQQIIGSIKQFKYQSVPELPTASAATTGIIYLVPSADPQSENVKDEYITVYHTNEMGVTCYDWEQIGSTAIDLADYYTKSQTDAAITADLNTALASYSTTSQMNTAIETAIANLDLSDTYETKGAAAAVVGDAGADYNTLAKIQWKLEPIEGEVGDKPYVEGSGNGMGRVVLKKGVAFADQFTQTNTIYVIQDDFDLDGGTLTIPSNSTLKFDGGSISGGTIVFNNTKLENPKFNCLYSGNVLVDSLDDRGFASASDDNCLSWLITQALLLGIKLTINRDYLIDITKGISGNTMRFVNIPDETLVQGAEIDFGGHTVTNKWEADGIRAFINAGNNIHGLSITNLNYDDITESGNDTHRFVKSAGTTILLSNGNCDNINIENITLLGGDSVYRHGNYQPDQNLVTTGVVDSSFSHIKVKNSGYSIAIYRGVNLDINVEALHTHRGIYLCGVENARVKYRGLNPSETHCHVMCGEESHYLTDEALAVAKEKAAAGISDLSQYTGWDMIGCSNIDIVAEILPDEIETAEITSEDAFQSGGSTYYGKSILMVMNEKLTITTDPVPSGVTIWYQDSNNVWHNTGKTVWQRDVTINPKDVKIVRSTPGVSVDYNVGVTQVFVSFGSYGNGDGEDVFAGRITKKTIHRNIRITPINRNKLSDIQGWFSSYHIGRDDIEMQLDNVEVHGGDLSKVAIPWLLSDEHCKASIRIVGGYYSDANKKTYVNMASSNVNDSDVRVIFENSTFGNIGASSPCTAIFVNSQYDYAGSNAHLKVHTYPNYSVNDGGTNGNAGYGITANRPTYNSKNTGSMYFDTILKRPVFWNGSAWIDPITFNHASKAYLDMGDVGERKGTIYYDLLLNKPLRYTGVRWVDANGKGCVKDFGTTAERPLARYGDWESYQASKPTNGKTIYVGFVWHNKTNNTYEIATAIDQSTGAITWALEATLHDVPDDAPRAAADVETRDALISAEYAYNNLYNGYNCWIAKWGWPSYIVSRTRTGAGTEASPYVYSVKWAPRKYYTDLLISADAGYVYYDKTLQKSIYAKTIDFAGNIFWAEYDGSRAGVQRTGTTAQRPAGNDIYVGFEYFDTDLGKTIYASTIASSSPYTVTWVDTDGNKADSRKLGLVTQRPALSDIVTGFVYIVTQDFTATIEDPISGEPGETVSCKAGVYTYILPIQSWATPMGSIIADSDFPSRT